MRTCLLLVAACLWSTLALGAIRTDEMPYEAGGTKLIGTLVYDDAAPGKSAGIVVFPEWWGANDYPVSRAKMLAQLGYVAFVADMYGDRKITEDPKEAASLAGGVYGKPEVMVGRAKAALQTLRNSGKCDPQRVAAMGYCMGGTVALNLARTGADLRAVIGFHCGLGSVVPQDQAGPIKARVLVMNGADDTMISPQETQKFQEEMRSAKADWQLVLFGNAVHAFTNPNADKHKEIGPIGYSATADKRSWEMMRLTLAEALGDER